MFIDLFIGHMHFGALGDDERELHSFPTRAATFQQDTPDPGQNQLPDRAPLGRGLFSQLAVKRNRNVYRCANGIVFHKQIISRMP